MSKSRLSPIEWVAWAAVVILAIVVTKSAGIEGKWQHATVDTVNVFIGVLIVTRPVWGRGNFWLDLAAIFLLHCIILGGIVQSLPAESAGLHGILMIPVVMAEGAFIVVVLWVRSLRSRSDPS